MILANGEFGGGLSEVGRGSVDSIDDVHVICRSEDVMCNDTSFGVVDMSNTQAQ